MAEPLWTKVRVGLEERPSYLKARQALGEDHLLRADGKARLIFRGAVTMFFELLRKEGVARDPDDAGGDGVLPGYTLELLDLRIGIQGFGGACASVGWLTESEEGLVVHEMNRWTTPFKTSSAHRERARRQYQRSKSSRSGALDAQNSAPRAQPHAPQATGPPGAQTAQSSALTAQTPAPTAQSGAEICPPIETETETEKTTTTSPVGAAPDDGAARSGVEVVVSELVEGEAERDRRAAGEDVEPAGWPERFEAIGVRDTRALREAGKAPIGDPRLAWILDACREKQNPPGWAASAIVDGWAVPDDYVPAERREADERAKRERIDAQRQAKAAEAERERDAAWAWYVALDVAERERVSASLAARGVLPAGGEIPAAPTPEQRTEILGLHRVHQHAEGGKSIAAMIRERRGKGEIRRPKRELPPGGHKRHGERWDEFWALEDAERRELLGEAIEAGELPADRPDREPTHDELAIVSQAMFDRGQARLEATIEAAKAKQGGGEQTQRAAG